MTIPGCAGYSGDEPNTAMGWQAKQRLDDERWEVLRERFAALESLYSAMKELTSSPIGYSPKVHEAMKKLKSLEEK